MSAFSSLAEAGVGHEIYYSTKSNNLIQSTPVTYNTRLTQDFTSLGAGSSSFLIPANAGMKCPVLVFGYDAGSLAAQTGVNALPAGWGYKALENVSFRVGGSQQLFMSGSQLLARNLRLCKTKSQRDALFQLGGSAVTTVGALAVRQYAYIPLTFWADPSVDSLGPPLASDLLNSQTQVTIQFKTPDQFWAVNPAGPAVALPAAFTRGYFVLEQHEFMDRSQSMAFRTDMADSTYIQRLNSYDQQELAGKIRQDLTGIQSVTFAGIMAGGVRALQVYLTDDNDPANSNRMIAPDGITVVYAGQRYSVYQDGTSAIFNLIDSSSPSFVDYPLLAPAVAPALGWVASPAKSEWVLCPFGTPLGSDMEATITVRGLNITNGSITLDLVAPAIAAPVALSTYTVHVVPIFTGAIAFSRGSANILIG
jgi:hypothetical protein